MILLDTNVLSEWMRPRPDPIVIHWLDQQPEYSLFIPAITKAEIETGISILPDGKRKQLLKLSAQMVLDVFSDRCLALDCDTTAHYAGIMTVSRNLGRPITVEDAQIAAIAITNNLTLATRNITDFDFLSQINLINPWVGPPPTRSN
jgi:predicted nucleic acid-binding protein